MSKREFSAATTEEIERLDHASQEVVEGFLSMAIFLNLVDAHENQRILSEKYGINLSVDAVKELLDKAAYPRTHGDAG